MINTKNIASELLEFKIARQNKSFLVQADNIPSNIRPVKIIKGLKYYNWDDIEKILSR